MMKNKCTSELTDEDLEIVEIVKKITANYKDSELLCLNNTMNLPNRDEIIGIIKDIRRVIFPGYFNDHKVDNKFAEYFVGQEIVDIKERLIRQIFLAVSYGKTKKIDLEKAMNDARKIGAEFIKELPNIQKMLLMDVQAGFDGDPAAKSMEEIIFS